MIKKSLRRLLLAILILPTLVHSKSDTYVSCIVSSSGETREIKFQVKKSALDLHSINYENDFRFSGIYLERPYRFKSYVYYFSKDRHVLIYKNEQIMNTGSCKTNHKNIHEVYSPDLEDHLRYECELQCIKK